ncbi:unnamed protein product [Sordaria macrospora k-hell]|uniref:WGS project CABT00000000 data, contig 2.23 n=1 Tax=Sordaria macrospora (strain ATCC MYA-333 / DSM 997 / K(L3346) / K-hell) TaxID=771870 RepID=F7W2W1_SORMK|nr:uncharacterized protein SMAC_02184 [Sordaria macrospora k-hell]CCC11962.1 unnamed protein product [Sordaria macrospora k-hell]
MIVDAMTPPSSNFRPLLQTVSTHQHRKLFAQLVNWYEDPECSLLTMEHVEHGNLQRYIEIGAKFPDRQAPLITGQIASALQYMHVKGFVHRNLRPSNILVAVEGPAWSVKLADFGIPANVDDPWPPKNYIRTSGYTALEIVDSLQ